MGMGGFEDMRERRVELSSVCISWRRMPQFDWVEDVIKAWSQSKRENWFWNFMEKERRGVVIIRMLGEEGLLSTPATSEVYS